MLLLAATLVALLFANTAWHTGFQELWDTPLGLSIGDATFVRPLHFWVNDGLMTIFFFVVGLEIRREIHEGELSDMRRAALPIAAALGGMLVPAAIYLAFNAGRLGAAGWGIPMATDIAFAVGALTLLGTRVTPALRVLLLALAVIDDIGAIVVIALFYSGGLVLGGLAIAAGGVAGCLTLRAAGLRHPLLYLAPAIVVWAGLYHAGIHPTLAGVVLGMMTPVRAWTEGGEVESASASLQHILHPWVAFAIMPLFALVNAGVDFGGAQLDGDALFVFLGILVGLALGKPIGIFATSRLAISSKLSVRPRHVTDLGLAVVGTVAGVGFFALRTSTDAVTAEDAERDHHV